MTALGHFRQIGRLPTLMGCPLHSESRHAHVCLDMSASCQKQTHALQQRAPYSITSSARASRIILGTSMPTAFAIGISGSENSGSACCQAPNTSLVPVYDRITFF